MKGILFIILGIMFFVFTLKHGESKLFLGIGIFFIIYGSLKLFLYYKAKKHLKKEKYSSKNSKL